MANINPDQLLAIEDLQLRLKLYEEAKTFLQSFAWCLEIKDAWFHSGFYDKLGVFLFEIVPAKEENGHYVWIIVGDMPPAYIDDSDETGAEALASYCALMSEWANNVIEGKSLDDCYPVDAPATIENAQLLIHRIAFIQQEMLSQR